MSVFVSAAYATIVVSTAAGTTTTMTVMGSMMTMARKSTMRAQLGPRPFYLVQGMDETKLKDRLMSENGSFIEPLFRSVIVARLFSFRAYQGGYEAEHAWAPGSWSAM
jgi:hypothetical protein